MTMELVAVGRHRAVVSPVTTEDGDVLVQFGESSKGNKQILVSFEIIGDNDPDAGRTVPWWGYFTEKTYERTLESLRYCGFVGDDLADIVSQPLDNEVAIVVEHNEYTDRDGNLKTSARVAWVNKPGSGGIVLEKPMAKQDLQRFAAALRGKLKAIPAVMGKRVERSASGSTPPPQTDSRGAMGASAPSDDDLPF